MPPRGQLKDGIQRLFELMSGPSATVIAVVIAAVLAIAMSVQASSLIRRFVATALAVQLIWVLVAHGKAALFEAVRTAGATFAVTLVILKSMDG